MTTTKMLHVRVDDEVKVQASRALEAMGLSISEAVRLFLHRVVVEQALPFDIKVPTTKTQKAMNEAEEIARSRSARFTTSDDLIAELEKDIQK
ncbi:MAG TPA: type II toxin-antitoxin system RelB/DinJ family antitoxin [Chroococcales cyanobacterium]